MVPSDRLATNSPESVAIVVLNHDGAEDTLACLESIAGLDPRPGTVHVVDNASTDGSVERIRGAFSDVEITVNSSNLGYGAGLNPLLERLIDGGPAWIWLLNNDARVASDALGRLLDHAETHPAAGAIGACITDMAPPLSIQAWGGGRIGWWRGNSKHLTEPVPDAHLDYVTGASMLLRTRALRDTGLFDPGFFLYWEDCDLCVRLRRHGWKLSVASDALVRHRLSASIGAASPAKDERINASAVRFFRKHGPLGGWPPIVIGSSGRIGRRILKGDLEAARAVWRGTRVGFRRRS